MGLWNDDLLTKKVLFDFIACVRFFRDSKRLCS